MLDARASRSLALVPQSESELCEEEPSCLVRRGTTILTAGGRRAPRIQPVDIDFTWDAPLYYRYGAEERLCGILVFYDFDWLDIFPDERTQFKNGKSLANFVQDKSPPGKTPALLLTVQDGVKQGFRRTERFSICVVNIREYRAAEGDAALSYLANHLDIDITDIEELQELAKSADPIALRIFIESSVDIGHIGEWARANPERIEQLRELVREQTSERASLSSTLEALGALADLPPEDIETLARFLGTPADREQRLELARAITSDPAGRYVTSKVLAERTAQRIADARAAIASYSELLRDPASTETAMQNFIEANPWLLGLDYAAIRARSRGPSGATDFLLERFDGFQDLLELKSPQDAIVRSPAVEKGGPIPPPHEYALSATVAQALAQALVYRDRLTRHAEAAEELFGLPHSRDPRLLIVVGRADSLSADRRRVLAELNKSLHRIEVVPYDVLGNRAAAVLNNVETYFAAMLDEEASADSNED
jgi:hypothetical protein